MGLNWLQGFPAFGMLDFAPDVRMRERERELKVVRSCTSFSWKAAFGGLLVRGQKIMIDSSLKLQLGIGDWILGFKRGAMPRGNSVS